MDKTEMLVFILIGTAYEVCNEGHICHFDFAAEVPESC